MCGTIHDRTFEKFEEVLDWLETTGVLVERFDPGIAGDEVAKHPAVQRVLAAEGEPALPLIAFDDTVVSRHAYVSRTRLARLIGDYRRQRMSAQEWRTPPAA
jgi:hypothetical protein